MPPWRNWQTHRIQVPAAERSCEFDSHRWYQENQQQGRKKMIIVMNEVFETCSDTDIYALDTDKIPSTNKFKAILQTAKDDLQVSDDDYDEFQDAKDASRLYKKNFPCTVDKLLTIYYE